MSQSLSAASVGAMALSVVHGAPEQPKGSSGCRGKGMPDFENRKISRTHGVRNGGIARLRVSVHRPTVPWLDGNRVVEFGLDTLAMKRLFRVVICNWMFFGFVHQARAQVDRGTIVLIDISQSRVIIAADSRSSPSGRILSDHACKITALGKKMLFAESGIAGSNHTVLKSLNWHASDDAVAAFKRVVSKAPAKDGDLVTAVAAEWEKKMKVRHTRDERTAGFLDDVPTDVLSDSVFAGLDDRGRIMAREVSFTFDRAEAQKKGFSPVVSKNQPWIVPAEMTLKVMGHSEVALEFASKSSERALVEAQRWQLEMQSRRNEDYYVSYLKHLIDLEATYAIPDAGVGGDVDIATLDSGGTIRWVRRKKDCPEDSLTPIK